MDVILYKRFKIYEIYRNVRVIAFSYELGKLSFIIENLEGEGLSGETHTELIESTINLKENEIVSFEIREE